jgi:hypothetical protein
MKTRLLGRTRCGFCCRNECWWMSTPLLFGCWSLRSLRRRRLSSLALAPLLDVCGREFYGWRTDLFTCTTVTFLLTTSKNNNQNKNNALPSTISSSVV